MTDKTLPAESGGSEDLPFDPADVVLERYEDMSREDLIAHCYAHDAHHHEHHEREDRRAETPASLSDAIGYLDNIADHYKDCPRKDQNSWRTCDCGMAVAFQCISRALREPQPASTAGEREAMRKLIDEAALYNTRECFADSISGLNASIAYGDLIKALRARKEGGHAGSESAP